MKLDLTLSLRYGIHNPNATLRFVCNAKLGFAADHKTKLVFTDHAKELFEPFWLSAKIKLRIGVSQRSEPQNNILVVACL